MALTPVDSYKLWQALDKHVSRAEDGATADARAFDVSDLKPRKYFSDDPLTRITLAQAHEYELALKARLEKLARERPDLCDKVLQAIASGESLKRRRKKDGGGEEDEDAGEAGILGVLELGAKVDSAAALVDLAFHLHQKKCAAPPPSARARWTDNAIADTRFCAPPDTLRA
jgi:hypothetical protein